MSKLLLDEQPLLFQKQLAITFGLNESIVIQQIHYWIELNKKANRNYYDGYYWVYNSFEKWASSDFPFWSMSTLKRIFSNLEKRNLLISANYNKKGFDRTKWYRINYEEIEKQLGSKEFLLGNHAKRANALCQNDTMHSVNLTQPIPETTQRLTNNGLLRQDNGYFLENNDEIFIKENYLDSHEKNTEYKPSTNDDEVKQFIDYYKYKIYKDKTGMLHPELKKDQYIRVCETLKDFMYEYNVNIDDLIKLAYKFTSSNIYTDYNINHFATEGILMNRFYEELY